MLEGVAEAAEEAAEDVAADEIALCLVYEDLRKKNQPFPLSPIWLTLVQLLCRLTLPSPLEVLEDAVGQVGLLQVLEGVADEVAPLDVLDGVVNQLAPSECRLGLEILMKEHHPFSLNPIWLIFL